MTGRCIGFCRDSAHNRRNLHSGACPLFKSGQARPKNETACARKHPPKAGPDYGTRIAQMM